MKNELPFVTSTYFIVLIKAWLQGLKTRQEILRETADTIPLPGSAHQDVTQLLTAAAREMNEHFYTDIVTHINEAPDTVPTRPGLVHHLEALIAGETTLADVMEWATWYHHPATADDQLSAGIFEDFLVEYMCLDFLPAYEEILSPAMCRRILEILKLPYLLESKIALVLLPEKALDDFTDFLHGYSLHPDPATLDMYLLDHFGMDRNSFPYITEVLSLPAHPENLSLLIKKATLS